MFERTADFFAFVKEREAIRLRKESGMPFPWTEDAILSHYKFTNVFRHHDRTSRFFREKFYNHNFYECEAEILMNAAIFRYFGTMEFAETVGWGKILNMKSHLQDVKQAAKEKLERGEKVFTGAYVITNQGISAPKYEVVVDYFLTPLLEAIDEIIDTVVNTHKWKEVSKVMRKLNGFGGSGFMTKEILLDTTYTSFWGPVKNHPRDGSFSFPKDWHDWTPVGPGARRGARRVSGYDDQKQVNESTARLVIMDLVKDQFQFKPTVDPMSPHDVQFQLCEFDKYERARLGQGRPRSIYRVRFSD